MLMPTESQGVNALGIWIRAFAISIVALVIAPFARLWLGENQVPPSEVFWYSKLATFPILISGVLVLILQIAKPQKRSAAFLTFLAAAFLSQVLVELVKLAMGIVAWWGIE